MRMKKIIAIIPAFNEALTIGGVVKDLLAIGVTPLVVDDGSDDATTKLASQAGALVWRHLINLGQGAALATGIKQAINLGAEVLVTFDADGQHQARDIERLLQPIINGEAEVVLGNRFAKPLPMPWLRKIVLKVAIIYTRVTSGLILSDTHNGLRAFTRAVAKDLKLTQTGMAHASEFIQEISRQRWRYLEVPVEIVYTKQTLKKGQSNLHGFKILFDLWFK